MTNFKIKSDENLEAGKILMNKSLFNASIHCFYYACVQMMLHALIHKYAIAETDIKQETSNEGSHVWLLTEVKKKLILEPNGFNNREDFEKFLSSVKSSRNKADYKTKIFSRKEAESVQTNASEFLNIIQTIFKL